MRLNQYIAHSGLCSRRDADAIIKDGRVTVNGDIISTMGLIIGENDVVKVDGKAIKPEKYIYILLNKPKDYITTTADEKDRKTVLDLILPKLYEDSRYKGLRIYPVGRLDRNTSGILLLTNDGDLTQSLTHPKFNVEKIYIASLNKNLTLEDMQKVANGVQLEDGLVEVDEIAWPDPKEKSKVGVAIHSGKNRVVRRIFESLDYKVEQLDRIVFAGLTKKNLTRGKWRFLEDNEVAKLKNLGKKKQDFIPPKERKNYKKK